MPEPAQQSISHDQFLLIAANLLHRALLAPARTEAKQFYRQLAEGRTLALTSVEMEDKSTAQFGVSLDQSEFRGRLNYGAFRASVETLVANLAAHLKEEKEVTVFGAEEGRAAMIFGVTAVTVEEGENNVMVLGAEVGDQATVLQLMYLDPAQFEQRSAG